MKTYTKIESKYYEYQPWEQPILSANGTMGGDSFACTQSSYLNSNRLAWKAFNADNTTYDDNWHSANGLPAFIQWYNPEPLLISSILIRNRDSDGSFINSYTLSYSDDNSTYTTAVSGNSPSQSAYTQWSIFVSENNPHKYWRLTCNSASGSNNSYVAIQSIHIYAKIPYNDYKDVPVCKILKQTENNTNTYKALRSWEKGQYYGN